MARRKMRGRKLKRKSSQLAFFALAALLIGIFYYVSTGVSASTNTSVKYAEVFNQTTASTSSYKVKLTDQTGQALKSSVVSQISISSKVTGKDCGAKNTSASHPDGGCLTIKNPTETPMTLASDGTITFQNTLIKIDQTLQYSPSKTKKNVYFSAGTVSGSTYTLLGTNTIVVKSKATNEIIAQMPIPTPVNLVKNEAQAKTKIDTFNNAEWKLSIPTTKLTSTLGISSSTPSADIINTPIYYPESVSSDYYAVTFYQGGNILTRQSYWAYSWYYECSVTTQGVRDCTPIRRSTTDYGIAGNDGTAQFHTSLINIGNDYFIGQALGNSRFKIWVKSQIIAIDSKGKSLGNRTITSPFSKPKFNFLAMKRISTTTQSSNKQSMIAKYDSFNQKEYKINVIKPKN
jgi:hypothetical protein